MVGVVECARRRIIHQCGLVEIIVRAGHSRIFFNIYLKYIQADRINSHGVLRSEQAGGPVIVERIRLEFSRYAFDVVQAGIETVEQI